MFWKFNLVSTSLIETLLQKENLTLKELMNEEDILQECKGQNKALIAYLIRPEIMTEMVDLVVCEPADESEDIHRYKYSNIASELLTSDVPEITGTLANDTLLLNKLYGFLETDNALNPLLASFFSKTIGILITRRPEATFEILKSKDFVNRIIQHFGTSAVMDLLLRLITCSDDTKLRLDILNWLVQQSIVHRLVGLIDSSSDEERQCNASLSICDIIRMARDRQNQMMESAESDPLLQSFESVEIISELLDHMFNGTKSESTFVNGIMVLLTLLEIKKPGPNPSQQLASEQSSLYFRPEIQETLSPQDEERIRQGLMRTVTAILPRLSVFHQIFLDPPKKASILTTIGSLDPPLGSTRIHLARLVTSFIIANVHNVNVELCKLGTINILIDLFFQYSWNNFLHTQVDQSIGLILSNSSTEDENGKEDHPLLDHLFGKCRLLERILDAWEDNEKEESKPNGHRKGYMGHLNNIANHIVHNLEKGINSKLIESKINELPEATLERWQTFVNGPLSELNKKNIIVPVTEGRAPNSQLSSEDDAETSSIPHETTLQQAFSDYQMQQMTSNFIDQFGFNDDEFGEQEENANTPLEQLTTINFNISAEEDAKRDLFDQICNERIQPLDDSDEDIWEDKEQEIKLGCMNEPNDRGRGSGGGPPIPARNINVDSDNSSDAEDESTHPVSMTQCNAPVISSNTLVEDIKMDIDQGEVWNANFDTVPMDTGNPWDSPSTQATPALATEAGWADFGNFTDFSTCSNFPSENSNSANVPVAMETSDDSHFKLGSTIFTSSALLPSKLDDQLTPPSSAANFDSSSPKSSQGCVSIPNPVNVGCAFQLENETDKSNQSKESSIKERCPSSVNKLNADEPSVKELVSENGPCKINDANGQLGDRWQENKVIDDARIIMPDKVAEASPNGPV